MYKMVVELDGDEILTLQEIYEISIDNEWKNEYKNLLYKLNTAPQFICGEIISKSMQDPSFKYLKGFHDGE